MDHQPQDQQRVIETILRPLEKKALNWLAAHMPAWVMPDHLTALGILASLLIAVSLVLTNISPHFLWLASLGVILNWFGDSLDGTLARYRKIERSNYGFYIDHAVDSVDEVLIFLALGLSPYVRMELAGLALVAYLLMSIQVFLFAQVKGVFQISFLRLGPTEIRCIMILANTVVFFVGNPVIRLSVGVFTLYDFIAMGLSLLLFGAFIVLTIARARELAAYDIRQQALKAEREARKAARRALRAERKAARMQHKTRKAREHQLPMPEASHPQ